MIHLSLDLRAYRLCSTVLFFLFVETIVPSLFTILLLIIFACCVYGCCIWEGRAKKEEYNLQKTEHQSDSTTVLATTARSTNSYLLKDDASKLVSKVIKEHNFSSNSDNVSKNSVEADVGNHARWTARGSLTHVKLLEHEVV